MLMLAAAIMPLQGAEHDNAGQIPTPYSPSPLSLEPAKSDLFFVRFFANVLSSDATVFDKLASPSSQLSWIQNQDNLGYGAVHQFDGVGANMVSRMALDSLRETSMQLLPLNQWQDYWLGRLASLFTGTIGHPQEEHVQLDSSSFSAARFSWESAGENSGVQWGFRPWRADPYLYFLARAGHLDGLPLITLETRAGYKLLGPTRLEGRLTLQLPASFRIAGSASFIPTSNRSSDAQAAHFGIALERVLNPVPFRPGTVFYVGLSTDVYRGPVAAPHSTYVVAGLSRRW